MKKIISVSRRTDIPAFYGDWFMRRLKQGFAGVVNPFGGRRYIVSLRPEDVACFVFWSKNFAPFIKNLRIIDGLGYKFYFNYTVTGLPDAFEINVDKHAAIETLKLLSKMYSPRHINWRFDPIIISSICNGDFYIRSFEELARRFEGVVERCYFSFVTEYDKVRRNFAEFERSQSVRIIDWSKNLKIELAEQLAEIAERFGIQMYSCCSDYLLGDKVKKAHCIDGAIIEELFFPGGFSYSAKPTRQQCGCTESTDIGTYDTCPHGCVYCYANADKGTAFQRAARYDVDSVFLAYSKAESDKWIVEIKNSETERDFEQLKMF